ncbi:AAA family ATPase [uncultured Serinicoccus sp.]|uniref:AAA family ATPase n=1 Tax=uncultured Serinicoccus sp. TaxID=735514 RepID=UPI002636EC35|nr:P-loop NTPase [uncultured Serinicoccus sp.]
MSRPLVTAVAPRWESQVAALLDGSTQARLVRRCADLPELLGVTRAGLAEVVLLSHDLRGLDRDAVLGLGADGVQVVGVHPRDDPDAARALQRRGVTTLLAVESTTPELDAVLASLGRADSSGDDRGPTGTPAGQGGPGHAEHGADSGRRTDPAALLVEAGPEGAGQDDAGPGPAAGTDQQDISGQDGSPEGEVVVVWGPHGSTGRTTVAVNLAAELASATTQVLLVDADTYGAGVAQALAVLDESPGVAAAARAADQGTLDADHLVRLAPRVRPGLLVLTGLPRADRWTELRESALADILQQARSVARWVVVDVAPTVEQDEELSFDTSAPRRNGAALCALEEADRVLVVGTGDPVGLQRLVRSVDQLPGLTRAKAQVVVTRVRPGPVGPEPGRRITETLRRFAGVGQVHLVPEDRDALDAALLHGHTLAESRPASPARESIRTLAHLVSGRRGSADASRSRWWPTRRART